MRLSLDRRSHLMILSSLFFLVLALGLRIIRTQLPQTQSISPAAFIISQPAVQPLHIGTERVVVELQTRLKHNPDDTGAYALLGLAYLQAVRESGDPALYLKAETAFQAALERDPNRIEAMVGMGVLDLALHQFDEAQAWGERVKAINPFRAEAYGIIGDAQLEQGQYEAAGQTMQDMVNLRPDLNSYSRVSYLRELYGDPQGAIEAMERALKAGNPDSENTLWTQVQLGHLHFNQGDLNQAERQYRQALQKRPDYLYAQAGLARVQVARGQYQAAQTTYETLTKRLPLPKFLIALGELYEVQGAFEKAQRQYELVTVIAQLNTEAGMNLDLELALFYADHKPDSAKLLTLARAAYKTRPTIYSADALAWALYQKGAYAEAEKYSQEARRLGTQDALLYYHAGMIADAQGHAQEAKTFLKKALDINPYFSLIYAPQAQESLKPLFTKNPS